MKKNYLKILLILINTSIIFCVNFKIETDLSYHSGKDGGMLTGLQMIVILSSIYFLVLSKRNKIIFLFVGFMIGVLSFLISYFVAYGFLNYDDIYCYLFAMIIFIVSFHLIERRRETWKKLKVNDINN